MNASSQSISAGSGAAEAAQACAALLALVEERRGRGLDLPSLLTLRHLSRTCSWSCGRPVCLSRSIALEACAEELYVQGSDASAEQIAALERRMLKLLGEIKFCLGRGAAA